MTHGVNIRLLRGARASESLPVIADDTANDAVQALLDDVDEFEFELVRAASEQPLAGPLLAGDLVDVGPVVVEASLVGTRLALVACVADCRLSSIAGLATLLEANARTEALCASAWGTAPDGRGLLFRTSQDVGVLARTPGAMDAWIRDVAALVQRVSGRIGGGREVPTADALAKSVSEVVEPHLAKPSPLRGATGDALRRLAGRFAPRTPGPVRGETIATDLVFGLQEARFNGRAVLNASLTFVGARPASLDEAIEALVLTTETAMEHPGCSMSLGQDGVTLRWAIDPTVTRAGALEAFVEDQVNQVNARAASSDAPGWRPASGRASVPR